RRCFGRTHARPDSRATFYFPQNSSVWENKKIDSRPPDHKTVSHAHASTGRGRKLLTLYLPYTRSNLSAAKLETYLPCT
ncbi:hypothetical protein, partial [Spirosoma jeollabukense]